MTKAAGIFRQPFYLCKIYRVKESIREKLKRLVIAMILGLILAIVTPFVLDAIAPDLQVMLAHWFHLGFEEAVLLLIGELLTGWVVYTLALYVIFRRSRLFRSDGEDKSLSLLQ